MELIGIPEAAARLGVNHKVIRRLISQGLVTATMRMGRHGKEWRIDPGSLDAYREATWEAPLPAAAPRSAPPPDALLEELQADKAFLQEQVLRLTEALQRGESPAPVAPTPEPQSVPQPVPPAAAEAADPTPALQDALRIAGPADVAAVDFAVPRPLWGRTVLWRTTARGRTDVARLVDAILASDARWDPPGAETGFVFARDAAGTVLWGAACGPRWFGRAFAKALRAARVERL